MWIKKLTLSPAGSKNLMEFKMSHDIAHLKMGLRKVFIYSTLFLSENINVCIILDSQRDHTMYLNGDSLHD